mmetsp:Transcript_34615/g.85135  ORF Transcript_34615/g.85135 Transcript_34615/m.85135 type:complete len:247 (-) Transcript_34615:23-763(-)
MHWRVSYWPGHNHRSHLRPFAVYPHVLLLPRPQGVEHLLLHEVGWQLPPDLLELRVPHVRGVQRLEGLVGVLQRPDEDAPRLLLRLPHAVLGPQGRDVLGVRQFVEPGLGALDDLGRQPRRRLLEDLLRLGAPQLPHHPEAGELPPSYQGARERLDRAPGRRRRLLDRVPQRAPPPGTGLRVRAEAPLLPVPSQLGLGIGLGARGPVGQAHGRGVRVPAPVRRHGHHVPQPVMAAGRHWPIDPRIL